MPPRKTTRRTRPNPAPAPHGTGQRTGKKPPYNPAAVRRLRRNTLSVLYIALGVEIIAALLTSPRLSIKQVAVRGTNGLPDAEAQSVQSAAKIPDGTNFFRAPVGPLEARLRKLPCVASASVSRRFPDSLNTKITLRQPVVIAETSAGQFETDAGGVAIRPARPEMENRLPHIVLQRPRDVQAGTTFADSALDAAILTLRTLKNDPALPSAKIEVDRNDNLCLNMQDGLKVRFGSPEETDAKIKLVLDIYHREPTIARRLLAVNLSCPSWPACTPRKPAAPPSEKQETGTTG